MRLFLTVILLALSYMLSAHAPDSLPTFDYLDVFGLEHVRQPQISPDGKQVVYRRMGFDIMTDRAIGQLWLLNSDGSAHQKLTSREVSESNPQWSPSGDRIAFVSSTDEGSEIYLYWVATGRLARLSQLPASPANLTWSPDGEWLAFSMKVEAKPPVLASMPPKPKGAKWAEAPRITDRLKHEADGRGYLSPGFTHLFVLPAEGGTARQLTSGDYQHASSLSWSPEGAFLYFSANRRDDWEYNYRNSEIYRLRLVDQNIEELTDRQGPDYHPQVSPDGKTVAFLSYEDKVQAYQITRIRLMDADGSNVRDLPLQLDRSVENIRWSTAGDALYFSYDDWGDTKIAKVNMHGQITTLASQLGGTSIGRPYPGGSFSIAKNGTIAYTHVRTSEPAALALLQLNAEEPQILTYLNRDLLDQRELGQVEEVRYTSSVDGRTIQGWIVKPPRFDASKKYPLLVENHGGPILNYGARFSAEMQLYAAAGYIVFYPNPRGSTGYGEEFANMLYRNYPGEDYQDVMDGVDYLIERGLAHEDQLYVTGGSAGGIMTAWIIGKNQRFEAAVVAKPVVNWISKTLVADNYYGYANYRYQGQPWENVEEYWRFSPLSLVAHIETPTMVMVGMNDLRTPPSEAKQLYHALKLRKIETVLVEIPEASHGIAARPSNLITKITHTLAWFEKYRAEE